MGENSKIEWTDHTFNPWRGCTKVAAGCANCYAEKQAKRNPGTLGIWGADGTRVLASDAMWGEPLKWNHAAGEAGVRARVFCASMADVFEDWPGQMTWADGSPAINRFSEEPYRLNDARVELFRLIDATPHLDWLLLTKRPENIRRMAYGLWTEKVPGHVSQNEGDGRFWKRRQNVWLGTSIATQEDADKNIPELLKCRDLSPVLFVSAEPLLGQVDLSRLDNGCGEHYDALRAEVITVGRNRFRTSDTSPLDWLIVGGESGPGARPINLTWARSLRDQCQAAGVPFFFKQWGEWVAGTAFTRDDGTYVECQNNEVHHVYDGDKELKKYHDWQPCENDSEAAVRVGKAAAGRLLDDREWNELPRVEVSADA
jgi:protein gp37